MAKNRRKKNLSERKRDVAARDESFAKLYNACNVFFDDWGNYEGYYWDIRQMYYDQLRKHYNSADWVNKRLKEYYVSDNLHGFW